MNIHELYGEIIKLTPYEGGDDDFRKTLSSALKKYSELVDSLDEAERPDNWDALKRKMEGYLKSDEFELEKLE